MEEKRKFGRIPFGTQVTINVQDKFWQGLLLDLSLHGAQVQLEDAAPTKDSPCQLRLPLSADLTLEFRGVVSHSEGKISGIHFTQTDPESYGHLIRLMELNTGDAEKVHQEILTKE
ncbi:MAG: PilZ domain-containing protein [Desulfuromonadaceae bacterium]|jgi:hypothetical protein